MNLSVKEHRSKMIAELRKSRAADAALVEEYISEAEHQDGTAFWLEFETYADMLTDFDLYKESVS
jgi:hypothetical protein